MAARINETTASHYSAAIWSMVHGLAMLLLERDSARMDAG